MDFSFFIKAFEVLRRRWNVCDDEQMQMPEGSEFQTEEAVMLPSVL